MDFKSYIKELEQAPMSSGKTLLIKHLNGEMLTRAQAMKAQCCSCMGYYFDGKVDCEMPHCPMYFYMPYRKKDKIKKKATPEQLTNLKKAREKRNFTK